MSAADIKILSPNSGRKSNSLRSDGKVGETQRGGKYIIDRDAGMSLHSFTLVRTHPSTGPNFPPSERGIFPMNRRTAKWLATLVSSVSLAAVTLTPTEASMFGRRCCRSAYSSSYYSPAYYGSSPCGPSGCSPCASGACGVSSYYSPRLFGWRAGPAACSSCNAYSDYGSTCNACGTACGGSCSSCNSGCSTCSATGCSSGLCNSGLCSTGDCSVNAGPQTQLQPTPAPSPPPATGAAPPASPAPTPGGWRPGTDTPRTYADPVPGESAAPSNGNSSSAAPVSPMPMPNEPAGFTPRQPRPDAVPADPGALNESEAFRPAVPIDSQPESQGIEPTSQEVLPRKAAPTPRIPSDDEARNFSPAAGQPLNLDSKITWRPTAERQRLSLKTEYRDARLVRTPSYPKSEWIPVSGQSKIASK